MKKEERINYIANILSLQGIVRIRELSLKLGVSEMTIRRDLDSLAQANIADLIPGGAVLKKTYLRIWEKNITSFLLPGLK